VAAAPPLSELEMDSRWLTKSGIPADGLEQALLVSLRAFIIGDVASQRTKRRSRPVQRHLHLERQRGAYV